MLIKNRDLLLLNLSDTITERTHLTGKKLKRKNIAIRGSLIVYQAKKSIMDQEIEVCFMINSNLVGDGQGLQYGKEMFGFMWGGVFNKGIEGFVFYFHILDFQYFIKRESTFKFLHIF